MIKNPARIKIERPGYKKFRVSDLGINIIGNPKKEYTIVDNGLRSNPNVFGENRSIRGKKSERIRIIVFTQNIQNKDEKVSYMSFSDGKTEACIPAQFQLATSLMSKVVSNSGLRPDIAVDKIVSGGCEMMVDRESFNEIVKAAERFGKVLHNERQFGRKYEIDEMFSSEGSVPLRYLFACLFENLRI